MVKRAELTPKLVFEIECPKTGELWVADTKIAGFGLRLWSTASGGKKAFAIRTANSDGKIIRKTFDISKAWQTRWTFSYTDREDKFGLGEYLEDARHWARDEIDRIKGKLTGGEQAWIEHRAVGELVKSLPLERAGYSLLRGLKLNSASQKYLDRLDKLFANKTLKPFKETPLAKLKPRQIAEALVRSDLSAGNVRTLRAFVSQIFERGATFHGPLGRFHDEFASSFSTEWDRVRKVRYPALNKLSDKRYREVFDALESEANFWQQALAIRIYFEFRAPLIRVLRAEWNQIYEAHWYPYAPNEKKYWFECRESIEKDSARILDQIRTRGAHGFNTSSFWFPTNFPGRSGYIRSVEHVWRLTLRKCGLRYYPLREFSRSYREFNNPSYAISFLRRYKPILDKVQNVAELSKNVARARKS